MSVLVPYLFPTDIKEFCILNIQLNLILNIKMTETLKIVENQRNRHHNQALHNLHPETNTQNFEHNTTFIK